MHQSQQSHLIIFTHDKSYFSAKNQSKSELRTTYDSSQISFSMLSFYITGVPLKVLRQVRTALDGKFKKMQKLTFDDQLVFFYHKVIY